MDASGVLRDINRDVSNNPVTIFGRVRTLMNELGANFRERDIDVDPEGYLMQLVLTELTGQPTVPYVFVNGQFIGGADDTLALAASGELLRLLREANAL
ncbi:hypothetical protein KFL_000270190 [Klebsormidium nitens]|uniref:Glutaredoxin domain-containing protein n=1 Tax=Klebsormidium nitens TaxID=105231 RepID=A0A1Y1HKX5_KLENI|nr:hypothetical protein KFL_000270190 [Klebsormidium nitens]|eukprot:GAQ79260.1 hypothetical protein KFL_000270190 [Klebsormidium nitens]